MTRFLLCAAIFAVAALSSASTPRAPAVETDRPTAAAAAMATMAAAFASDDAVLGMSSHYPTSCGGRLKRRCECMTWTCSYCDKFCLDNETCDENDPGGNTWCENHYGTSVTLVCECTL